MSAWRTWRITCDGCEKFLNGDIGGKTTAELRESARLNGAHVNLPRSRDICAACWRKGKR